MLDELIAKIKELAGSYKTIIAQKVAEVKNTAPTQTPTTPTETPKTEAPTQEKPLVYQDVAEKKNGAAFIQKVKEVAARLKMDPNFMMATMKLESGFSASIQNPTTHATGLIQFMPSTAKGLGTTVDALKGMSAVDQMDYVEKYYKQFGTKASQIKEPAESYLLVFYPAAIGKPDDYILGSEKSMDYAKQVAKQNPLYDTNKDGFITKGEVVAYQREHNYKQVYLDLKPKEEEHTTPQTEQPTTPVTPAKTISASVGEGGDNKAEDVLLVKSLLNKFGAGLDPANVNCGPKTVEAIKNFQKNKAGFAEPDGLVSPNGKTWKVLNGGGTTTPETPKTDTTKDGGGKLVKPNWVAIAEKEIGVAEIVGAKHNPRIIEYHATTGGFKDDETPWCSSFVNWVMKQAGIPATGSALALSWAKWGKETEGAKPAYGAVCVKTRKGGGHVGIVVGKKGSKILVLGGNQGDKCCVVAYNPGDFFTYRFPSNYTIPANAYLLQEGTGNGEGGKES